MNCEGCMFQRYRMTEQGQAWYCRKESTDEIPVYHYESASECKCKYGY